MPLVRIDLPQSIAPERRALIGDIVYDTMVDVLSVPTDDKFQIITAHDNETLRIDPTYLDIARSPAAFVIDITLNAGRTVELKKQFYASLVDRLETQAEVRPQDVLIVLTEVAKENWSFGNGEAQYA
jgi:phenylpyruvate tautomerase PptA (4-oxalocrotonate tautomerase family)